MPKDNIPMQIVGVQSHLLQPMWPYVSKYFESFEERARGEITKADLIRDIAQQKRQMWVATDGEAVKACALSEVISNPMHTVTIGFCSGEDREEWRDMMVEEIWRWGKEVHGAKRLRIICRPGWARELKKTLGMKETHRVLEIDA